MKIELHSHSSEISPCGHLTVDELTSLYRDAGYDALVLTNHFNTIVGDIVIRRYGKPDYHRAYFDCIAAAREAGERKGLLVLPGHELRFDCNANDYLVFGMSEEMCRDWRTLCAMTEEEFGSFARENGVLFYQAHPFRNGMTVVDPRCLFGMEIINSHPRHENRNPIAAAWAKMHHLHRIAGSDCHQRQDVGSSAILTDEPVRNIDDLVRVLKNDLYRIESREEIPS